MTQNYNLPIIALIIGILLISCSHKTESEHSEITGIYFGQKLPLKITEKFAPDIISTQYQNNSSPTFSIDMNEVYWSISFEAGAPNVILFMKRENNKWSNPAVTTFSGQYSDGAPFLSPDGKKLFFHSDRPMESGGEPKDNDIWFVERTEMGWSEAVNAGKKVNTEKFETYPSVSSSGNLYFNSFLEGYPYDLGIYKSQLVNGLYGDRIAMDAPINSTKGFNWCPFIDPEERYLIFASGRDGQEYDDLYCSFKKDDHTWSDPIDMGASVNSEFNDRFPSVSPDGKYIFVSRPQSDFKTYFKTPQSYEQLLDRYNKMNDDIYWISSKVIEEIKPNELKY